MNEHPRTAPIPDNRWSGLAGALQFDNGDRPWYAELQGNTIVCAALESIEVHRYGDAPGADASFAFYPREPRLTSLMGRAIAETIIVCVEKSGLEKAAELLGLEKVI